MDETGHSGDTGAAESGAGADSRDRTLLNGWSRSDGPWSNAGSALDPEEDDVPNWRRPSTEVRPFTRQNLPPEHPSGEVRPFGERPFVDRHPSGEVRPFGSTFPAPESSAPRFTSGDPHPPQAPDTRDVGAPRWSESRSRYSDLMNTLSANGAEPTGLPAPAYPDPTRTGPAQPGRPDSLENDDRQLGARSPLDAPAPNSAPPYPYEGDLDDATRNEPPAAQQRAAVPLERPTRPIFPAVRPATPGGRRADWAAPEPARNDAARHALDPATPLDGLPRVEPAPTDDRGASAPTARSSYDPVSFPRRLRYDSAPPAGSVPPADASTGYAAPTAYTGYPGRPAGDPGETTAADAIARALPQRVPAEPDVPTVPEPPSVEPPAETPALARIATHLRRDDVLSESQERQEGFDVQAILAAVREVEGVRDASLRSTPAGAHSLRLDLAEGADPAEVSRHVARLLQDRMGLDAAMQGDGAPPLPAAPASGPPVTTPFVPSQAGPGRAPTGTSTAPGEDLQRLPTAPQAGRAATLRPAEPEAPAEPVEQYAPAVPVAPAAAVPGGPIAPVAPAASRPAEPEPTGVTCVPPRPLDPGDQPGPRVVIDNVQVNTFGNEATVEVRLSAGGRTQSGVATGPAFDGYLLRLCAMATATALDDLLVTSKHDDGPARCFVEHAAAVPFGSLQVAVVVVLLSCGGWVEQLSGSAVVAGEDRYAAMVRATLAAVNRRLEALLA
ncbi:Daple [Jidongwangia harbinensis]|uniref:Daple n=1 Tax=Jidongwangia harbinensis TaxID=2878561 RepID=UPI001CD9DE0F|nr:Daple [Jidongwangia harbinensis]MCA2213048.1 Daple [Jidongwangia harbinensis]